MKDRITKFLKSEGISPAEFADKIGVQRSSVSHVLNGRNYPSASFIQKMLSAYQNLNPRWLLLGEGSVLEPISSSVGGPSLFELSINEEEPVISRSSLKAGDNLSKPGINTVSGNAIGDLTSPVESKTKSELNKSFREPDLDIHRVENKEVERVLFFYNDKTFDVYTSSK